VNWFICQATVIARVARVDNLELLIALERRDVVRAIVWAKSISPAWSALSSAAWSA